VLKFPTKIVEISPPFSLSNFLSDILSSTSHFWKTHGSKKKTQRNLENFSNGIIMKIKHQNYWEATKEG